MQRSRTTKRLEAVREVLKSNDTAVLGLGEESQVREVESGRIVSSDSARYILVRGNDIESQSSTSQTEEEEEEEEEEGEDVLSQQSGENVLSQHSGVAGSSLGNMQEEEEGGACGGGGGGRLLLVGKGVGHGFAVESTKTGVESIIRSVGVMSDSSESSGSEEEEFQSLEGQLTLFEDVLMSANRTSKTDLPSAITITSCEEPSSPAMKPPQPLTSDERSSLLDAPSMEASLQPFSSKVTPSQSQPSTSEVTPSQSQPSTSEVTPSQPSISQIAPPQPSTSEVLTSQLSTSEMMLSQKLSVTLSQPPTSKVTPSQPPTSEVTSSQPSTSEATPPQPSTSEATPPQPSTSGEALVTIDSNFPPKNPPKGPETANNAATPESQEDASQVPPPPSSGQGAWCEEEEVQATGRMDPREAQEQLLAETARLDEERSRQSRVAATVSSRMYKDAQVWHFLYALVEIRT